MQSENLPKARILVLVGNYGSGKTEISLNLALKLARRGEKVTLVDLDIVNPYFRSSERTELLEKEGVKVYAPSFAMSTVDVPSLPADIQAVFADKSRRVIFDVGGDDTGAAALGQYKPYFDQDDVEVLFVAFRRCGFRLRSDAARGWALPPVPDGGDQQRQRRLGDRRE